MKPKITRGGKLIGSNCYIWFCGYGDQPRVSGISPFQAYDKWSSYFAHAYHNKIEKLLESK